MLAKIEFLLYIGVSLVTVCSDLTCKFDEVVIKICNCICQTGCFVFTKESFSKEKNFSIGFCSYFL